MYRNVFYNQRKRSMRCWSWDENGQRISYDVLYKPYIYIESHDNPEAQSIYNTPLKRIDFDTQYERYKYVKDSGLKRIFYNVPINQQFLIEQYSGINETQEFSQHPLKIFFLDIEVLSPNEFPEAEQAKHPINLITIYDSLTEEYHTWGLGNDYTPKTPNVHYYKYDSETEMLKNFIEFWEKDYPDVATGWNSEGFDIPYIINRITNILGEVYVKRLSPVNSLKFRDGIVNRFGQVRGKWTIHGISCIDYMDTYITFSPNEKSSNALNYIAEEELGETKLALNTTNLSNLAASDWDRFVDYNIHDVSLLIKLDDKLQYLSILRMLAYTGLTNLENALGTISIVTGAMANEALKRNQIISTFSYDKHRNFEGGLVLEPKRGLKECVVGFDANSLYPNTIVTLNLSPETKIGKIVGITDDKIEFNLTNGRSHNLSKKDFFNFIQSKNISISKARILFSQNIEGICPALIKRIYTNRVENKKKLKEHRVALSHCKEGTEKYKEHNEAVNHLDTMQYTLKILMNRIYGAFANKYSPFHDIDLAASITLTGQGCIKQADKVVNEYAKTKYGIDEEILIAGDTDSAYVTIKPILDKIKKQWFNDKKEISLAAYRIVEELEGELNKKILQWGSDVLNSRNCTFEFKRESMSDIGIFIQKKRYILHIQDDEGIVQNKTKYVGVEVVRSTTPKVVKPLIKNIIETMITTGDQAKTNAALKEAFEAFQTFPVEEISFPKSIKDYDKYANTNNSFNTIKRCPIHVKSAIYYNNFLKRFNVTNKYERIKSGNKIKFFYTQPNKYNVNSIAFLDKFPDEIDLNIDINKMFEKLVISPTQQLFELLGWVIKKPTAEYAVDLFEILG